MNRFSPEAARRLGTFLSRSLTALVCCGTMLLFQGCQQAANLANDGLLPGVNYMQPMKWRLTYRYRVQQIHPQIPGRERPWSIDGSIPTVGKGTYEVWMLGPREGEEVRDVKMVHAHPKPTAIEPSESGELDYYYYDFTPDGLLPKELQATVQWEFVTFERYTFWDGMQYGEYDKESELYKKYTANEWPITWHVDLRRAAKACIPEGRPEDVIGTALNCYNTVMGRLQYDFEQQRDIAFGGSPGMYESTKSWDMGIGICDEFANTYCAMLRSQGIPARACAGMVHDMQFVDEERREGYLACYGHAWAEFYLQDYGWIPVDPTWGQNPDDQPVSPLMSYLGSMRGLPMGEYYFGKHDSLRATMMKEWNYKLRPAPKTPGAKKEEAWLVGYTDRHSGVEDMNGGWPGISGDGYSNIAGWHRSAKYAKENFRFELEALGPISEQEIPEVIEQIKAEGAHYLKVPPTPGNWPIITSGKIIDE